MFGLLNIDKPQGMTSREVVNRVQRLVKPAKAGHAGTLDPLATGVLLVCVGPATRLIENLQRLAKSYRATFLLGRHSETEDTDGEVIMLDNPPEPTRPMIEARIPGFLGTIRQRPPAYSALKVRGRRAYDLARRGESFALKERSVIVHRLEILSYQYPELQLDIECGSGTYVRSLGRDLAQSLGSEAVMSHLTRTAIGSFRLEDACHLDDLPDSLGKWLLPPSCVFEGVPAEVLMERDVRRVIQGQAVSRRQHGRRGEIPALDGSGRLVAVLVPRGEDWLRPVRTFPPTD